MKNSFVDFEVLVLDDVVQVEDISSQRVSLVVRQDCALRMARALDVVEYLDASGQNEPTVLSGRSAFRVPIPPRPGYRPTPWPNSPWQAAHFS
jgi:glutaredoxin 2